MRDEATVFHGEDEIIRRDRVPRPVVRGGTVVNRTNRASALALSLRGSPGDWARYLFPVPTFCWDPVLGTVSVRGSGAGVRVGAPISFGG